MTKRISSAVGQIAESATLAVDSKAKSNESGGRERHWLRCWGTRFATPAHIVAAATGACQTPNITGTRRGWIAGTKASFGS